ncbi:hypothetical protein ACH5RR_023236 [Cinchona calisaya]|uniref:Uncharacterized protein n=1 Tax=Cinchona calisaya TaxID=153742 RepID=A0ABD2ZB66_9GENT
MKRKRREISLSDICAKTVLLVPDLILSDRLAAHICGSSLSPALPFPSSSGAPAGTSTEVATKEQLDLSMELDLPILFRHGDFLVPPLLEEIQVKERIGFSQNKERKPKKLSLRFLDRRLEKSFFGYAHFLLCALFHLQKPSNSQFNSFAADNEKTLTRFLKVVTLDFFSYARESASPSISSLVAYGPLYKEGLLFLKEGPFLFFKSLNAVPNLLHHSSYGYGLKIENKQMLQQQTELWTLPSNVNQVNPSRQDSHCYGSTRDEWSRQRVEKRQAWLLIE